MSASLIDFAEAATDSRQESGDSARSPTFFDPNTTNMELTGVMAYLRQSNGPQGPLGLPRAPYHLEICPTNRCQIDCRHCSYEQRNRAGLHLDPVLLNQLLEDAREMGVVGLYWSGGGDPLAAKNIDHLVAKSASFSGVAIQTNAISLDRLLQHGCHWFNHNCDLISWSIYASSEPLFRTVCQAGPDKFQKIVENMECAVHFRDEWMRTQSSEIEQLPPVHLSGKIVVSRHNYRELPEILAFAQSFRLDSYHIRLVENFEPDQDVALNDHQIEELRVLAQHSHDPLLTQFSEFLLRRKSQPVICPKFSLQFGLNGIIETNGDVFLSIPSDGQSQFSIGNINRNRLSNIWGSSKHKEVIKQLEALKIPVSKDRHHKINMAINEHVTGSRTYKITPEMLTARNFRLFQRAQI